MLRNADSGAVPPRVVAVGVCAAAGAVLLVGCTSSPAASPRAVSEAGRSGGNSPVAEQSHVVRSKSVSVIGDSFSAGSQNDVVWPDVLAARFGWSMDNVSEGGAGYVAGADFLGTFADQVDAVVQRRPDVALVVGSENDVYADPDEVGADATHLFDRLAVESPSTRVIVIGPIWSGDDLPVELTVVDDAVERAADAAHFSYIDALPLDWLADPEVIQDDGDHPTDEGQVGLADDIAEALRTVDPQLLG